MNHIERLTERIDTLTRRIKDMANEHLPSRRLQTMPGIGPLTLLAPEIVEASLDGKQRPEVTLARMLEPYAMEWTKQVALFMRT